MIADPFTGRWTRAEPACWSWPIPDPRPLSTINRVTPADMQWDDFHDGRCALCGERDDTVEDHDHATGLLRGLLCRSCNTIEGRNHDPDTPVAAYRERNPATILGYVERYFDSFAGRYDQGTDGRDAGYDRWKDNPMRQVGL